MNKEPIARLPFGPSDPWYRFVSLYKGLALRTVGDVRRKSILAHSSALASGVRISSTFSGSKETGRLSFNKNEQNRLSPENIVVIKGWGWRYLNSGPDELPFVKELDLVDGVSTMPMALILPLPLLGVNPDQDWGVR